MAEYGLIGFPLSHSFSPGYFQRKFKTENIVGARYTAFPIESVEKVLDVIRQNPQLRGLNVTIPYKEKVLPLLHELDDSARNAGAVNTIKIIRSCFTNEFRLIGYNTDITGFEGSLREFYPHKEPALVLGTGGASKAVRVVLDRLSIPFILVSRSPVPAEGIISYDQVTPDIMKNHRLIINTTPVGMHPDVEAMPPIDPSLFTDSHYLYDLIYNPEVTLFLQKGSERGARIMNGYRMLVLQAEASWKIWNRKGR